MVYALVDEYLSIIFHLFPSFSIHIIINIIANIIYNLIISS